MTKYALFVNNINYIKAHKELNKNLNGGTNILMDGGQDFLNWACGGAWLYIDPPFSSILENSGGGPFTKNFLKMISSTPPLFNSACLENNLS